MVAILGYIECHIRMRCNRLPQALEALTVEAETASFFGDEFLTAYTTMRAHELSRFNDHVTDWERQEYIELF